MLFILSSLLEYTNFTNYLMIDYDTIGKEYWYSGNIKGEYITEIVSDFLHLQIGKGGDDSERENHDLYQINLKLDLSSDTYTTSSNCGNKGLREGILMYFLQKLREEGEKALSED